MNSMYQITTTEAAHTGPHGIGQKSNDTTAIPLCGWAHHREGAESIHKLGRNFFAHHGIDREEIIKRLVAEFESNT